MDLTDRPKESRSERIWSMTLMLMIDIPRVEAQKSAHWCQVQKPEGGRMWPTKIHGEPTNQWFVSGKVHIVHFAVHSRIELFAQLRCLSSTVFWDCGLRILCLFGVYLLAFTPPYTYLFGLPWDRAFPIKRFLAASLPPQFVPGAKL